MIARLYQTLGITLHTARAVYDCVRWRFLLYQVLNRTIRSAALPYPKHGCRRMPAPMRSSCKYIRSTSKCILCKLKYTPAVRSNILSKLIFSSCVWYSDRAYFGLCVLFKDTIGRRLPLQLQCSYQGQQGDVRHSMRGKYKTRFWGGQNLTAVKGNASIYQANPVRRITGEGRAEFLRTLYIYDHYFFGDSIRSFFRSRPQHAILGTGILGQIASFKHCLRGAAQTPLALPYPFRTWPGSGTWAERDKREVRKILYFGRYTPELFLDLGICRAWRNKTYIWQNIFFQVGAISKLASYFVPHHTFFMVTPRSVWFIVVRLLCSCFLISDFTVKYLCSSLRCLRGGPFPTQRHPYTQCVGWFFILAINNLLLCGHRLWDRESQTVTIDQGIYTASEMLACRVREHNKTGQTIKRIENKHNERSGRF